MRKITTQAAGAFLAAFWPWIGAALVALILILYVAGSIQSCSDHKWQKKNEQMKEEIQQGKGEIKEIEEQKKDANENIKQSDRQADAAAGNFNAVINTDSSTREANWSKTRAKWCQDHQSDSKCR